MVVLGSVFLGDAHQHRLFPTTPPTSPPPIGDSPLRIQQQALRLPNTPYMSDSIDDIDSSPQERIAPLPPEAEVIPSISPELSLELRLRWLEALLFGVRQELARESRGNRKLDSKDEAAKRATLLRRAEEIQHSLNSVIQNHEGIRKFMDRCKFPSRLSYGFRLHSNEIENRRTVRPIFNTGLLNIWHSEYGSISISRDVFCRN